MPRKTKFELVTCPFFKWRVYSRRGVYYADGRANDLTAGRHSLGTKNRDEAMELLRQLDQIQGVELGLASEDELGAASDERLSVADGVRLYSDHVRRPAVTGGTRPSTQKRYRTVFDKFTRFLSKSGIRYWNGVTRAVLEQYAAWLDDEGYAYRSEFTELTTIKQSVNWLIAEGHLPESCKIRLPLKRPVGTDTFCWQADQVTAMRDKCLEIPDLHWLGNVITALACTGMRIAELASLRWSDIDFENNVIQLTDETAKLKRGSERAARQIKNRRGRSFPIHEDLRPILQSIPRHSDGYVFHGPLDGRLSPDIARRTLIRDVLSGLKTKFPSGDDEVGFKDGRLHSFRHYFCSVCANSNVPEQVVMNWLGHRDSQMVRHYYHLHDDEAQRQMLRVQFLGKAAGVTVTSAVP